LEKREKTSQNRHFIGFFLTVFSAKTGFQMATRAEREHRALAGEVEGRTMEMERNSGKYF